MIDTHKPLWWPLLTLDEAAHVLDTSRTLIRRAIRTGAVTATELEPWGFKLDALLPEWRARLLAQYQHAARRLRAFDFRRRVIERGVARWRNVARSAGGR